MVAYLLYLAIEGDDVTDVRVLGERVHVMTVKAKSRARLTAGVVADAREGLEKHRGGPDPETLAFLDIRLREEERGDEAEVFTKLQLSTIRTALPCLQE